MNVTSGAGRFGGARAWLGAAALILALAIAFSWSAQRRLDAWLDRLDAGKLDESVKLLDQLVTERSELSRSAIGVIADDARIRAMVLTPTFDRATVVDLLTDLQTTSGASVVAMLDSGGVVRAVVGAPEMDQLALGTSSLVRGALEKPSAQLWAFANKIGVLAAAPVRLDGQVRALFMMGYELGDGVLEGIEETLGVTGAFFVADSIAASAGKGGETEEALRTAAELAPGAYRISGAYLARSSRLGESAVAARAGWLVPLSRQAGELTLTRVLAWLPTALVGLVLAAMIQLALGQSRDRRSAAGRASVNPVDAQGVRRYEIEPD